MSLATVNIVDSNDERASRISHILDYLGYQQVAQFTPQQLAQTPQSVTANAVILLVLAKAHQAALAPLAALFADKAVIEITVDDPSSSEQSEHTYQSLHRIPYPFNHAQLLTALHRAEHLYRQQRPLANPKLKQVLVGESAAMTEVRRMIEQVATTDANVLILGESGTGKEVVASSLHYLSQRQESPFVPVNCGAIPADLLESELFGHEKGAFTGALTTRQGRFEIAAGGTLFLDEIGDMPMPMQVKLLRVLQERTFERVGSSRVIKADVRIVAATHRDLEESIAQQRFREDLYFRLNVFPIEIPPLRQRSEDIPTLVHELIARFGEQGRGSVSLTATALASLQLYAWPGNVRELANLLERLVILYPSGVVDYGDLPERYRMEGVDLSQEPPLPTPWPVKEDGSVSVDERSSLFSHSEVGEADSAAAAVDFALATESGEEPGIAADGLDLKEYLADLEQRYIQQALAASDGVVAQAALLLKMRRTTLVEKIRKYGL
ncbi:MAG: sigma-54-dependent Fis family transcriptional regulator [Gammaproteobacteria bacterium]|nr:sigma-54-dependent Fis family transcriptional regulator [Gammaproteobacteria bacterium]